MLWSRPKHPCDMIAIRDATALKGYPMNNPRLSTADAPVIRNQRLGNGDNTPMTYSPEQLDMLRHHFQQCGAPFDRLGLDHWLKTRVDDGLRESVVAQLFPGSITYLDYAQNQINAGVPENSVRLWLAPVMAPADRERVLREAVQNKKVPIDRDRERAIEYMGAAAHAESEARANAEYKARARQLEAA